MHRRDRHRRRLLQRFDLARDLLGRRLRAHRELLHLGRDNGKAATGGAGARRLDGGVEGEQVRLARDIGDQIDHLADVADRRLELVNAAVGGFGGGLGVIGQRAGCAHTLVDLAGGLGEFGGGGGDLAGVAPRILRLAGEGLAARANRGQCLGGSRRAAVHRLGGLRDVADHGAEVELEKVDRLAHRRRRCAGVDARVRHQRRRRFRTS